MYRLYERLFGVLVWMVPWWKRIAVPGFVFTFGLGGEAIFARACIFSIYIGDH